MTELVVCSGKGGTGKTSVTAGLAALARDFVLADCDVDAANLHLVLNPEVETTTEFRAGHLARIDPKACDGCGVCRDLCRFSAIDLTDGADGEQTFRVRDLLCEGCGVCVRFCPGEAIDLVGQRCGEWYRSRTPFGPMVHASLDVGAENSGKLVTLVREQAGLVAEQAGLDLILLDGPPGIGCPVTAAVTGADLVLLVTEPSLSGLHDLERIVALADHFEVPAVVCINKHDLSPRLTRRIEEFCELRGLDLLGRIPFDPAVNDAQAAGRSIIEFAPHSETAEVLTSLWSRLEYRLSDTSLPKG